jgi:2-amino-4-hydroxy-6-hydroxymethyldihydropteridine diphosphokinase
MSIVYIGIGSNINPEKNLKKVARLLRKEWPKIKFSSVYKTAPRELVDQPDFLNAVGAIETETAPEKMYEALEVIEKALGKAQPERFGPRTIDLDLLLYSNQIIHLETLIIPHPRMHERRFVLEPLMELLDPNEKHPVLGMPWKKLLEETSNQRCERISTVL